MKKIVTLTLLGFTFFLLPATISAQGILDRVKNKIKQRSDAKVDNAVDKTLDGKDVKKAKTDEDGDIKVKTESGDKVKVEEGQTGSKGSLKSYSRFDFVPGDKIAYAEDFAQDVIGEFPLKWNTNGSGELVTLEGIPGKWLQLIEGTKYVSPYKTVLPENYTVEFDLLVEFKEDQRVPPISIKIYKDNPDNSIAGSWLEMDPNGGMQTEQESGDRVKFWSYKNDGSSLMNGKDQFVGEFTKSNKKMMPVHVAIWVQKQRYRAWINQQKVYDLPRALPEEATANQISFEVESYGGAKSNYKYFLSNLKVAVASPDTRSKLITEGKFSTTGILFDVNSDQIKPASYGVLKEIAGVLTENSGVKVKIIGHTDSDGDDAKNLDLSKRRAAAVKTALSTEFNIDASRMETDGMGETKPVGDNKTSEGKAQNRRVEFVKI
jgi:outer membrane protein OmpA-like peptidoglycan-associated protein